MKHRVILFFKDLGKRLLFAIGTVALLFFISWIGFKGIIGAVFGVVVVLLILNSKHYMFKFLLDKFDDETMTFIDSMLNRSGGLQIEDENKADREKEDKKSR